LFTGLRGFETPEACCTHDYRFHSGCFHVPATLLPACPIEKKHCRYLMLILPGLNAESVRPAPAILLYIFQQIYYYS